MSTATEQKRPSGVPHPGPGPEAGPGDAGDQGPPAAGGGAAGGRSHGGQRVLLVVGVLVAVAGLVATLVSLGSTGPAPDPGAGQALDAPFRPDGLERLAQTVARNPDDWRSHAALAQAYVQRARVTGDPTLYPLAEQSADRSLEFNPTGNVDALIARASLASARHDFAAALGFAEQADTVAPADADVQAVLGDALVELGRYPEAFAAFQRMVDLRPDLAAYSRVSYARELQGDTPGAIDAMEAAKGAAGNRGDQAFTEFQLGELYWNSGRPDEALARYRQAAELDPTYFAPQAALARAAFFDGDGEDAVRRYQELTERIPLPQYVSELADVHLQLGQAARADQQLAVLAAQQQLFQANGVNVDLELALFNADHGIDRPGALEAAQREWERRPSIVVADTLAWALHANGRDPEALTFADQALSLGTLNPLFLYHRARIHQALGNQEAAQADLQQALQLNPNFSLQHAADARQWAGELGLPVPA